jgi:hypothetical protein
MMKRVLTLDNALNITSRISINGDAGPGAGAGCTTAPVRHVPRESREQCRRPPEAERNSLGVAHQGPLSEAVVVAVTNGRLDGSAEPVEAFGTWERILGVSWMADTGVLTAGGGSGYWSRSSGRCDPFARNYANRHRGWAARGKQSVALGLAPFFGPRIGQNKVNA